MIHDLRTRTENLRFDLYLDKTLADTHAADIELITSTKRESMVEGDTYHVAYELQLSYFGTVEKRLEAMNRLLSSPEIVKQVALKELTHGQSLFVGIVQQIEAMKAKLIERE